ncbi:Ribonuclease P protein subunit p25-like protein [Cucurbita argyrosperma subsp. argyrosperma]|nr:Ribonuclease P protein subunit p25-like protein [Cucurbita argyrosperma subsp. argyrosperma]
MDRYQKVEKPKPELPISENEIRITTQGAIRNYITYASTLLQEKRVRDIVLKAMGQAISKAVAIAEILKKRISRLHQETAISSVSITDVWEPIEEGLVPQSNNITTSSSSSSSRPNNHHPDNLVFITMLLMKIHMAKAEGVVEGEGVVGEEVDMGTIKVDTATTKVDMATTKVATATTKVVLTTTKVVLAIIKIMVDTRIGDEEVGGVEAGPTVELDTKEAEEEVEVIAVDGGEWVVAQGGAAGETRLRPLDKCHVNMKSGKWRTKCHQVLQWVFKETNEKDSTKKKETSCDKGSSRSKEIVVSVSNHCGGSQGSKGFEGRRFDLKRLKSFALLCRKDIAKSCFYSTINIKRPRTTQGGLDNMHQYWIHKMKKEDIGQKVDSCSVHAGTKVLPITDATLVEQCGSKGVKKVVANGESKTKAKSRVKELLRWAMASRSEKGGKFHECETGELLTQAWTMIERVTTPPRSVSDGKPKAAPPFPQPTRRFRGRPPSKTVPLHWIPRPFMK